MLLAVRRWVSIPVVVATAVLLAGVPGPPSLAAEASGSGEEPSDGVVPIDWDEFDDELPGGEDAARLRAILLNTNRYALTTWFDERGYGDQNGDYLDLGGTGEHDIRPVAAEAFALATALATGAYDEEAVGVSEQAARDTAVLLATSVAHAHLANQRDGWGDVWQSALWAAMAGFAGWLLWDELPADDQELVERMVVHEADRFLFYEVPYWKDADGSEQFPGDSKAEENSWNAMLLQVATAMLPDHQNWAVWQDKNLELMISAFARPDDLTDNTVLHGKPVARWLDGWNMEDDGLVINHGIIHPDYMTTVLQNTHAVLTSSLAGQPTPEAALHNFDVTFAALVDREFASPPFDEPGGTMYIRDSDEIYFPEGTSWGTSRRMHFVAMDAVAHDLELDGAASLGGSYWEPLHAGRALQMQERHDDGRTYAPEDADPYQGREEWVAMHAGWAYLNRWLVHQDAVETTNRAYPVRPGDYPGASLGLETEPFYAPGEATPVTAVVQSESRAPLVRLSFELAVPDGWQAVPADGSPGVLRPGETASLTWLVTPDPDTPEGTARLDATVSYRHFAQPRTLEDSAHVEVGDRTLVGLAVDSSYDEDSNPPSNLIDGDTSTWWASAGTPMPHWVELSFAETVEIGRAVVHTRVLDPPLTIHELDIESAQGDDPLTVQARVRDNEQVEIPVEFGDPLEVDRLRVTVHRETYGGQPRDFADLSEIEIYDTDGQRIDLAER